REATGHADRRHDPRHFPSDRASDDSDDARARRYPRDRHVLGRRRRSQSAEIPEAGRRGPCRDRGARPHRESRCRRSARDRNRAPRAGPGDDVTRTPRGGPPHKERAQTEQKMTGGTPMTAAVEAVRARSSSWVKGYEFKAVALMALGLGVVGFDRFIINPLFPIIQKDLGLSYQDLGLISAVLALTWGVASIFSGQIADRLGHKPVMVVATLVFSA